MRLPNQIREYQGHHVRFSNNAIKYYRGGTAAGTQSLEIGKLLMLRC